jgi:hypothetical protein
MRIETDMSCMRPAFHFCVGCLAHALKLGYWVMCGDESNMLPPPVWQPRSCRFMLLRTLKALPQPLCGHLNGFSPVCEWLWILRLEGLEKALLQVGQM